MPVDAGDPRIRRSGIGGSDIAAILGLSPWSGPMDVWLEKIGQAAPLVETERMRWGHLLEDPVAKEYARKKGRKVRNAPTTLDPITNLRARVVRHSADKPWRMANVDRLTSDPRDAGVRRGLECKTADRFAAADFGEEDTDQVPVNYLLQCMWYMAVTGYDLWDLAVLIGGNTHRVYTITRDNELVERLFNAADEFWIVNVLQREPPPADGTDATRRYYESVKPKAEDEIPMTDELYGLALHRANLDRQIKELTADKGLVENRIREVMPAKGIARRDNAKITWSTSVTRRLDTKALQAEEPDVAARFMRESEESRLTITVKEES